MATVNGVNYAKTNAPSDGNWKLNPVSEVGGTLRVLYDTYVASSLAAGSTINVGRIPQDSRVWNVIMVTGDLSATATLSVGDSSDVDRFITASICGDANKVHYMHPKAHASDSNVTLLGGASGTGIDAFGHTYTAATDIIITTATAAISGTIKIMVIYSID